MLLRVDEVQTELEVSPEQQEEISKFRARVLEQGVVSMENLISEGTIELLIAHSVRLVGALTLLFVAWIIAAIEC